MSAPQQTQSQPKCLAGIVKQVLSGDTVVIRHFKGAPPPEKTIGFSSLTAPKLAKRGTPQSPETQDEPWAWEAREFLRKKIIGKPVYFVIERSGGGRDYGTVYLGNDANGECINELMVKEGYLSVRDEKVRSPSPELQRLLDLQEAAKAAGKGRFADEGNPQDHVRKVKWNVDDMQQFVDKCGGKPMKAVIEHVRDGSTVRAFLLPEFHYITLMMSGIRCPLFKLDETGKPNPTVKVDYADEARFFTECKLLHQDVEIILDSVYNNNFMGTILHPNGNIAEILLKNGYARCFDLSIAKMKKGEAERLRLCEKQAKEKRLRLWKNWAPPPQVNNNEFVGTVIEVINGDALNVRLSNGTVRKIFLASIKPPRLETSEDKQQPRAGKNFRPLYEVPWMFEAREFLRKKLIGKKVNVTVDYVQPARDNMPEKCCCTVTISSVNVAEALVSKGLATVVKYRPNDEQRASAYDALLAAETKANKGLKGLHNKKDIPTHRVNDCYGDSARAKALLPHLSRNPRVEALVEFVVTGARLRLFLPKDSSLITFLLSGIEVKHNPADGVNNEEAALQFVRDKCMQREVEIKVEGLDRVGNFFGWLWVDNVNLSVALVEEGLAKIHFSGENSEFSKQFLNAKNTAKSRGLWKFSEKEESKEAVDEEKSNSIPDRKIDYRDVIIIETKELGFYCQYTSAGPKLEALQAKMAQEMTANPPLPGAYTPRRGDYCAAKFPDDDMWYRARVEKVSGNKVQVYYIDYGNRAEIEPVQCAPLPGGIDGQKPFAHFFNLACVSLPKDPDYRKDAEEQFWNEVRDKKLQLNVEYTRETQHASLVDPATKEDIAKNLISEGLLLVEQVREQRLQKLVQEYIAAQDEAKKKRKCVWEYGDITEDDDKEFGMGR